MGENKKLDALSFQNAAQAVSKLQPLAQPGFSSLFTHAKRDIRKADSHRDLYAPKSIFSRNTANKIHGRRQPCRGFFHCLAEKSFSLECFAVLNIRFFLAANLMIAEILCVFQDQRRKLRGKRFIQNRVNPYVRPPKGCLFF